MAITFTGSLNLQGITAQMGLKAERAVDLCCKDLLRKSVEVCPKDEGELRKSGTDQIEKKGIETVGKVGFGGDQTSEYAVTVHEMPDTTNWSEPGTGSKYLEKPFVENSQRYLDKIAEAVRV